MKETGKARVSPVCDFVNRVGNDTDKVPKRPCWANVSRLWTSRANPTNPRRTKPKIQPLPLGGGVKRTTRERQRRKKLARRPAQNLSSDRNITLKNQAVEKGVKKEQEKESGSVSRPASGPQRPAEPVASGFFVGSNRAEKCGSVKGPWRQAVGRGCQIFPALSHSVRCHNRGCGNFLLSAGQAEHLAVQPGTKCGAKPRTPSKSSSFSLH